MVHISLFDFGNFNGAFMTGWYTDMISKLFSVVALLRRIAELKEKYEANCDVREYKLSE